MDFAAARQNMVDCQILPNRVTDPRIVDAMLETPRERFVKSELSGIAYVDEAVSTGEGRFVMEPMLVARLLQEAELKSEDVALCIGCATGYAVAVMSRIVNTVVAIESNKLLAQKASDILAELSIDNAAVIEAELTSGKDDQGPYDVIYFDGAVDAIPEEISNQLSEGGRLVAVVADNAKTGTARLAVRFSGVISVRDLFDAGTPFLPGFEPEESFAF